MALARTEDGRTYSTIEEINELIHPTQIGIFELPETITSLVESIQLPLTADDAQRILDTFDSSVDKSLREEGFVHRRVGCLTRGDKENPNDKSLVGFYLQPGPSGVMPVELLKDYATPHKLAADDRHHVYSGRIIKGLVLPDGSQAMVYVGPGEWIRLHKTTLNWPAFPFDGRNIAISYFDAPPPTEDDNYEMNVDPSVKIRIQE